MQIKAWGKYLLYTLIILSFMYFGEYLLNYLNKLREIELKPYFYQINLITFSFCSLIGFLIGLEYFFKEKQKEGIWKINLPKLILIGLPSLYFSLYAFIYYSPVTSVQNILSKPLNFFLEGSMTFIPIFHFLFGYVIITSLYKVTEE